MEHKKDDIPHQLQELSDYIDQLFVELEENSKRHNTYLVMLTLALIGNIAGIFLPWFITIISNLIFWGVFIYGTYFVQLRGTELHGKIDGCFTTLEILGMMDKGHWTKRKKPRFSDLFTPLVKVWETAKEKMRREPYGQPIPALAIK